jgi:hypothetical protein
MRTPDDRRPTRHQLMATTPRERATRSYDHDKIESCELLLPVVIVASAQRKRQRLLGESPKTRRLQ